VAGEHILIVDDEHAIQTSLRGVLEDEGYRVTAVGTGADALRALADETPDLIFLDIHMPKLSGIEFLKNLRTPPLVIFTTAYSDYALEGYSLDVVDYLMKPITFERFLKAAQKALDVHRLKKLAFEHKTTSDYFFVKCESKYEKVNYADVKYVESLQNYVIIHTSSKKLITYMTLSSLENQLPGDQFLKVHKSFIVSISGIKAIDGNEILIGD
jgi:DNA-binding LytR/AlgR family response regulator